MRTLFKQWHTYGLSLSTLKMVNGYLLNRKRKTYDLYVFLESNYFSKYVDEKTFYVLAIILSRFYLN